MDCFQAYDIRGVVGESISEDICYNVARAAVKVLQAKDIVIGHDARETSLS